MEDEEDDYYGEFLALAWILGFLRDAFAFGNFYL